MLFLSPISHLFSFIRLTTNWYSPFTNWTTNWYSPFTNWTTNWYSPFTNWTTNWYSPFTNWTTNWYSPFTNWTTNWYSPFTNWTHRSWPIGTTNWYTNWYRKSLTDVEPSWLWHLAIRWRSGQGNGRGHLQGQDDLLTDGGRRRSATQRLGQQGPQQDAHHYTGGGGESVLLDPIKTVVQRRCFDKYCATRDGYRAKAFKPSRWTDCTGPWAGGLYGTNKPQSVNVGTTCSKIIYDKHLHGENLAKMGASPWIACVSYAAAWTSSTTSFGTEPTGKWLHAETSTWPYSKGARGT